MLVLKHFLKVLVLKALYKHFSKHKCLTGKSTIVSLSVQLNPAAAYLNYQLPIRLSGVLSTNACACAYSTWLSVSDLMFMYLCFKHFGSA